MPTLGNLRSIEGILVDYRNPSLRWTGSPTNHGLRPCTISGTIQMAKGHQLEEMASSMADRVTVGEVTGVQVYIVMDGDALASKQGYYIMESFDLEIEHRFVFADRVSFTFSGAYMGDLP
jgi:hypothetical protein